LRVLTVLEVVFFATPNVEDVAPADAYELGLAAAGCQSRQLARDHEIGEQDLIDEGAKDSNNALGTQISASENDTSHIRMKRINAFDDDLKRRQLKKRRMRRQFHIPAQCATASNARRNGPSSVIAKL
jgi:hypothetical protein